MRKFAIALAAILALPLAAACGAPQNLEAPSEQAASSQSHSAAPETTPTVLELETASTASEPEAPADGYPDATEASEPMLRLTIGSHTITAVLEDTEAAAELAALLKNGPITMPASNYGGFEKVCDLGVRLSADDTQITTEAGDIMLYNGSHIVIFYGSNSWAYTRLARVEDTSNLEEILSGDDTEVVIALADLGTSE